MQYEKLVAEFEEHYLEWLYPLKFCKAEDRLRIRELGQYRRRLDYQSARYVFFASQGIVDEPEQKVSEGIG